jgi:23S rRNA pseudouridine1911/1915/1917 synthase
LKHDFEVTEGAASKRLDLFLASELNISRSRVQKQIDSGAVLVNKQPQKASYAVEPGDKISFELPNDPKPIRNEPPTLAIIYEDSDLLVIDKPSGLSMHPGAGESGPTVADFARVHTSDPDPERPGIVHRLDKDTSGLVIIAKTPESKAYLQGLFKSRQVRKTYLALVTGRLDQEDATIDLPIARDPKHPLRQAVTPDGRDAVTRYHTLAAFPGYTLLEVTPATGRTHQIRVHFATLGHPVAGDPLYGQGKVLPKGLKRLFLHSAKLEFNTAQGQPVTVVSPPPADLDAVLSDLG